MRNSEATDTATANPHLSLARAGNSNARSGAAPVPLQISPLFPTLHEATGATKALQPQGSTQQKAPPTAPYQGPASDTPHVPYSIWGRQKQQLSLVSGGQTAHRGVASTSHRVFDVICRDADKTMRPSLEDASKSQIFLPVHQNFLN